MSVNRFKFGIRKAVGTPSAEGAMGTETLASHTSNPSAHADYVRKGCIPKVFDETEHLLTKTAHASNYLRRDEVMTSRLEYVLAKDKSYTKDSSNYMKESGLQRHVVTAFVLRQVLDELGLLDGTHNYLSKTAIVRSDAGAPLGDWETLVPSYKLLNNIGSTLTANNTAMQKAIDKFTTECGDKATSAVTKADDAIATAGTASKTATKAMGHSGYVRTDDKVFVENKAYYYWNEDLSEMVRIIRFPGTDISKEEYYEEVRDIVRVAIKEAGYARSEDTTVIAGKTYYQYKYPWGPMSVAITSADTNPAKDDLWELLTDLTTKPMAHAGYTQTGDLTPDSTKTYYKYDYAKKSMVVVEKPVASDIGTYWEKVTPRGIPFPDWTKDPTSITFTMSDDKKQYNGTVPISGTVFLSMQLEVSDAKGYVNLSVVPTSEGSDPIVLATFVAVHTYADTSSTTRVPCIISFRADVGTKLRLSLTDTIVTFKDAAVEMAKVIPDKLM